MEARVPERRFLNPSAVGLKILCASAKLEAMSAMMVVHSLYMTFVRAIGL